MSIYFLPFVENEKQIECEWDKLFGDRKNEIVFIGQNMDEKLIKDELELCLSTDDEINSREWKSGYSDEWPVERMKPLKENQL